MHFANWEANSKLVAAKSVSDRTKLIITVSILRLGNTKAVSSWLPPMPKPSNSPMLVGKGVGTKVKIGCPESGQISVELAKGSYAAT